MHLAKTNVGLYLTRKRERRAFKKGVQANRKRLAKARAALFRITKAGIFGSHSEIARMLSDVASEEIPMPQTSLHLRVPATFSMLEAPDSAIRLVTSFARTQQNRTISDVFVDFQKVKTQDLGAHALLDKLVDEVVAETTFRNRRVGWKGTFPQDAAQRRFIAAMGVIRQLRLTHKYLEYGDAQKIHLFERRCRHYVQKLKNLTPQSKSAQANAAERFANHVNRCLAREGRQLTPLGRARLCSYVGEIIDNAENHAGMVDWTIQGYVDMAMDEPQCEVVIFNFGKSISQTLDEMPAASYTMDQIKQYLDLHTSNGWFTPKWRRQDLLTLLALQGSVSSKNESSETDRGQGTADLIEFFQQMNDERMVEGNKPASMYIVSGGTRILFDPKYRIGTRDNGSRVIAFNSENDLNSPPDPSCVMPLIGCQLPGTMIGIKFSVQTSTVTAPTQVENA